MEIIRGFANLPRITLSTCGRDDDVFVDRLNYKYTTLVLFVSSLTITIKILQSDHIQCWVPAILSRYEHYINVYCWISNTYYVTFKEQTTSLTNKPERMLKYYQWVPMILLVLAFFFLLPRFMYRFLSKQSGLDLLNLADAAVNYMSVEKFDKRRRSLLYLANSIHFYSICNKTKRTKGGFFNSSSTYGAQVGSPILGTSSSKPYLYSYLCCHGKLYGSYLVALFMLTKLCYVANSIAQLFIMNIFLGFNFNSHGFHVLKDITKGLMSNTNSLSPERKAQAEAAANVFASQLNLKPGQQAPIMGPTVIFDDDPFLSANSASSGGSGASSSFSSDGFGSTFGTGTNNMFSETTNTVMNRYFPRESACDFRIRANIDSLVHNYTVQCVLPINLYNEQLFTLLWIWLWFVCIANCYDFVIWVFRLIPGARYNYVRSRIRLRYSENSVKRNLNSFVYDYLTFDGVFILRLMSLSMSDCVTHEIIQTLWQNYTETGKGKGSGGAGNSGNASKDGGISKERAANYAQRYSNRNQQNANDSDNQEGRYQTNLENI